MCTSFLLGVVLHMNCPFGFIIDLWDDHWGCSVAKPVRLQNSCLLKQCCAVYFLILSRNLLPILWAQTKLIEPFFAKPVPQSRMKTALCSAWGWTFLILSCFSHPLSSPAPSSEHNSVYVHPSESACWWLNAAHKGSRKTQTSCKKKGQTQSSDNGRKRTTSKHRRLELCGWAFCILWRLVLQQGLLKRRCGHRAAVVTS